MPTAVRQRQIDVVRQGTVSAFYEFLYSSYRITCLRINSAGNVVTEMIIGSVPQPADAFYILFNFAFRAMVTICADVDNDNDNDNEIIFIAK